MARRLRIEYPGAIYHVTVRGNNREKIFTSDKDKQKYIDTIAKYKAKLGFLLYAFVLLDNHAHLLLEVAEEPLSRIMQRIQQVYTQYYNWKYERTGHVFQQRYNAKICLKDEYLMTLINYIHYNPVKAGLCENLNYRWSSHLDYIHPHKKGVVDTEFPLTLFGKTNDESLKNYKKLMGECIAEEIFYPSFEENKERNSVGRKQPDNEEQLESAVVETGQTSEVILSGFSDLSLKELQSFVACEMGIKEDVMFQKSRLTEVVLARRMLIYLANKFTKTNNSVLARYLGLSKPSITKILNEIDEETKEKALLILKKYKKDAY